MRRSRRIKSMARAYRAIATLTVRSWRSAPWLLTGAILLGAGLLGIGELASQIDGWWAWAALMCAGAAPFAGVFFNPPRRPHPGVLATLATFAMIVGVGGYMAAELIRARTNSFYSAALLTEGALLLFALIAVQAALRRVAAPPSTAAPRASDALMDGSSVLLIAFFLTTAAALLPFAGISFLLALGFAVLAVVFRAPGALAQIARRR